MADQSNFFPDDDDESLQDRVDQVNALCPIYFQWEWVKANKDHVDVFGDAIRAGEEYLKRSLGGSFMDYVILSQRSMQRFAYCLLESNSLLKSLAAMEQERRERAAREAFERMAASSPFPSSGDESENGPR